MKSTVVDAEGNVRCPKCGSRQFTAKRTGKAKWGGVITLGVGVAAMPKRLHCQGCGENLKTGSAGDSEWAGQAPAAPVAPTPGAPRPSRAQIADAAEAEPVAAPVWQQVLTQDLVVGDQIRFNKDVFTITGLEEGRMKTVRILVDHGRPLRGLRGAAWEVRRSTAPGADGQEA